MKLKNIFNDIPRHMPEELMETLAEGENIRIERIISRGHTTPENKWYDQEESEFVLLLKGKAKIMFEKEGEISMQKGDWLVIPAHSRHRVTYTSTEEEAIWLTAFFTSKK